MPRRYLTLLFFGLGSAAGEAAVIIEGQHRGLLVLGVGALFWLAVAIGAAVSARFGRVRLILSWWRLLISAVITTLAYTTGIAGVMAGGRLWVLITGRNESLNFHSPPYDFYFGLALGAIVSALLLTIALRVLGLSDLGRTLAWLVVTGISIAALALVGDCASLSLGLSVGSPQRQAILNVVIFVMGTGCFAAIVGRACVDVRDGPLGVRPKGSYGARSG